MLRITFAYPDFESLGVEYLMSVCMAAGHKTDLIFYHARDTYCGEKRASIPYDEIARRIADSDPDVAAFSCVTDNFQFQLGCAKALKRIAPHVKTIFGGVHITAVPEKVLSNPAVDAVAVGEADMSFPKWLNMGDTGNSFDLPNQPVQGIVHKKGVQRFGDFAEGEMPDLDCLPIPHKEPFFEVLADARYAYRIVTSRGCPFVCSYCHNSYLHKLRGRCVVRQRSVDHVIEELAWVKSRFNPNYIIINDDCFTLNTDWMMEFCRRYKEEINIPFCCITSPLCMDVEKAKALSSAGCLNLQIGIQSISETLCKEVLSRKSNNRKIAQTLAEVRQAGIMTKVDHMLGIPGDTLEAQENALLFYNKYRPRLISVFWLTYYPKTSIVDYAEKTGILRSSQVEQVEKGLPLTDESYLSGGSLKDPKPFYAIAFLLNWLVLLPKPVVTLLVRTRLYRLFRIKSFLLSTAIPRIMISIFNRADFLGRAHLKRVFGRWLALRLPRHRRLHQDKSIFCSPRSLDGEEKPKRIQSGPHGRSVEFTDLKQGCLTQD